MNILVIGGGGREHALGVRFLEDQKVSKVIVYPGNPGMRFTLGIQVSPASNFSFEEAFALSKKESVELVVIGPEAPLFQGWVDQFIAEGIPAFGPSKAASFLEESKIKSKVFMKEAGISTAAFESANSLEQATAIIEKNPHWEGHVLKLSGPALGKGVIVTQSSEEALQAARDFFKFKPPGIEEGMVIEEKITGREVSLFYVCFDEEYRFLASACDHKRLKDNDEGPNTGGMGAYSPATWISDSLVETASKKFVEPTLKLLNQKGTPFRGILFLGLMLRNEIPYLLEYNVRFGDPETQTFLPRIEGDFSGLLHAVASGDLEKFKSIQIGEKPIHSVHVVKASKGYPGLFGEEIELGKKIEIKGPVETGSTRVYFAGVKEKDGSLYSSGGRVLGLTATAGTVSETQKLAYQNLGTVSFEGEQFRNDIGAKR